MSWWAFKKIAARFRFENQHGHRLDRRTCCWERDKRAGHTPSTPTPSAKQRPVRLGLHSLRGAHNNTHSPLVHPLKPQDVLFVLHTNRHSRTNVTTPSPPTPTWTRTHKHSLMTFHSLNCFKQKCLRRVRTSTPPALDCIHFSGHNGLFLFLFLFFQKLSLSSVLQCTSASVSTVTIILVMQLVSVHECTYEGAKGWAGASCQGG